MPQVKIEKVKKERQNHLHPNRDVHAHNFRMQISIGTCVSELYLVRVSIFAWGTWLQWTWIEAALCSARIVYHH